MTLEERISSPGPKKLLALDGGGIRGVITLEILARIEQILRNQSGREGLDQLGLPQIQPEHVRKMDSVEFIAEMQAVGRKIGEIEVKPEHFAAFPPAAKGIAK